MIISDALFSQSGNEVTIDIEEKSSLTISLADYKKILKICNPKTDSPPFFLDDCHENALYILAEKLLALKYSSYILTYSDKSEQAIFKKLKEKGFSEKSSELAISTLRKENIINDQILCERFIRKYADEKYYGERRIRSELYQKGFSRNTIDSVFNELELDFDEVASNLFERIIRSYDLSDQRDKKRMCDKMVRYGHNYDVINNLISELRC